MHYMFLKNTYSRKGSTMFLKSFIVFIVSSSFVCSTVLAEDFDPKLHEKILPLSPEDSLKTMVLQDGYSMEIVAAEPLIEEPVTMTFDGNGRVYVAEMLTYMVDAEGSNPFNPVSRIKRLEDKDGDGIFESFTVFADNLLLPRMISTLDDGRILVRETNTLDLLLLTDTDGDGTIIGVERISAAIHVVNSCFWQISGN